MQEINTESYLNKKKIKNKKREYGKNRHHNMSNDNKSRKS